MRVPPLLSGRFFISIPQFATGDVNVNVHGQIALEADVSIDIGYWKIAGVSRERLGFPSRSRARAVGNLGEHGKGWEELT